MDHLDEVGREVRLYCHSTGREAEERGIERRFSTRLEADLQYLAEGLHMPGRVKNYDKVLTRIGRLRQRYSRVIRYYDIRLEQDVASGNAKALVWTRLIPTEETLPGVYCLRTDQADWDERTRWHTYTMLTDLELAAPHGHPGDRGQLGRGEEPLPGKLRRRRPGFLLIAVG